MLAALLNMYICHADHYHSYLLLSLIVACTWGGWDLDIGQDHHQTSLYIGKGHYYKVVPTLTWYKCSATIFVECQHIKRPKQRPDFQIIIWTFSLSNLHLLSKALESALTPHGDLSNDLPPKVCVLIALWSCKNIFLVAGCCSCKKIPSTSSSSLPLLSPLCPGVDVIGTQSGEDLSFLIS